VTHRPSRDARELGKSARMFMARRPRGVIDRVRKLADGDVEPGQRQLQHLLQQ
jgi:hypothetical protein